MKEGKRREMRKIELVGKQFSIPVFNGKFLNAEIKMRLKIIFRELQKNATTHTNRFYLLLSLTH